MVSPGLIDALLHSCQLGGSFYDFFDGDMKVLDTEIFQQETADLATFAVEIFNGKLHFLYSENIVAELTLTDIAFIVLFRQEKPLRWKEKNTHQGSFISEIEWASSKCLIWNANDSVKKFMVSITTGVLFFWYRPCYKNLLNYKRQKHTTI